MLNQALHAVQHILEAPNNGQLFKLENFLVRDDPAVPYPDIRNLTAYPSELTAAGLRVIVAEAIAEAPAKKKALRDLITSSDVTVLCAFLRADDRRDVYKTIWSLVNDDVTKDTASR